MEKKFVFMIDILEYFKANYSKNDYYKAHYFYLKDIEDIRQKKYFYQYFDDEEIINAFKDIVKPENEKKITLELEEKFIMICFYLCDQEYIIQEFPELLKKPKSAGNSDLYDFMYGQIRIYIISHSENHSETVTWDERRKLINKLHFQKNTYSVSSEMDEVIKRITTDDKLFNELSDDAKLEAICNSIEYLLKKSQKFIRIDENKYFYLISNDNISNLRKTLQCYRHATEDDIKMREKVDKTQKLFLIRYGIMIIETLIEK